MLTVALSLYKVLYRNSLAYMNSSDDSQVSKLSTHMSIPICS
jgi:hypothetical protein